MVYASNDGNERQALRNSLISLKNSVDKWLCLGDFNVVRDLTEKVGSVVSNLADINSFNDCLFLLWVSVHLVQ